jgi:hypothetical protein
MLIGYEAASRRNPYCAAVQPELCLYRGARPADRKALPAIFFVLWLMVVLSFPFAALRVMEVDIACAATDHKLRVTPRLPNRESLSGAKHLTS